MMLQPPIWPVDEIHFPVFERIKLVNGVPLYLVSGATEPVFKIELQFQAGRWYELSPGAAQAMCHLIAEDSGSESSPAPGEEIEFYGAQLYHDTGPDFASFTMYGLNKHAQQLIPVLAEMLLVPKMRPDNLDDFKEQATDDYQIHTKRNEFIADQIFREVCFGPGHPYGRDPGPEELQSLTLESIQAHHQQTMGRNRCTIFLSGAIDKRLIGIIDKVFGSEAFPEGNTHQGYAGSMVYTPRRKTLKGNPQQQCAIVLGRPAVARKHPDFRALYMLNTLLGGFFGSRLMHNIREEKGLTYYIGSSLEDYANGGVLAIQTEVNPKAVNVCLGEIRIEMERLRSETVDPKELAMLRSYITGNLIAQCDGPLRASEYLKQYVQAEGPDMDIEEDIRYYLNIGADEIRRVAQKYLDPGQLTEVVVGG